MALNYKLISLALEAGKIIKKIIWDKLVKFLESNDIIFNNCKYLLKKLVSRYRRQSDSTDERWAYQLKTFDLYLGANETDKQCCHAQL